MFEDFEVLTTIDTRKAETWKELYPVLDNNFTDFTIKNGDKSFVLRIQGNLVAKRLYFSIFDSDSGEYVQAFMPLQEYPFNLAMCQGLAGAQLYYANQKILYKSADEIL